MERVWAMWHMWRTDVKADKVLIMCETLLRVEHCGNGVEWLWNRLWKMCGKGTYVEHVWKQCGNMWNNVGMCLESCGKHVEQL